MNSQMSRCNIRARATFVKDEQGGAHKFEKEIIEWASIKGKGTTRNLRRPVVILELCLAGKRL